jgi:hypothetical protein
METSALMYTGQILSTLIGNDLMTKAISDSANTIYNLLYGLVEFQDPKLERTLEELDVKEQVRTVETLIRNLHKERISESINLCLEQLHEIICRIREDLKQISINMDIHKTKWLYSYRPVDNNVQITNLKKHKHILDQRLDMFMKVFRVESPRNKPDTVTPSLTHKIREMLHTNETIVSKKQPIRRPPSKHRLRRQKRVRSEYN